MSEGEKSTVEATEAPPSDGDAATTAPASDVRPRDAAPPPDDASPPAAAPPPDDASPPVAAPPDDAEAESVEVEPVVERPKSDSPRGAHHLPPPPPSIRTKSTAPTIGRFAVGENPKLAQDLMTRKLFTIGPEDIIAHMEEHMQAFRFRHLPVVVDRKLVGLISHEDLLRVSPSLFAAKAKLQEELIHQLPAKHVMQKEVVTVRPTDTLQHVAVVMWEAKVGCVLVTDTDGTLVGIVTEGDFIRLAHHFLTH